MLFLRRLQNKQKGVVELRKLLFVASGIMQYYYSTQIKIDDHSEVMFIIELFVIAYTTNKTTQEEEEVEKIMQKRLTLISLAFHNETIKLPPHKVKIRNYSYNIMCTYS